MNDYMKDFTALKIAILRGLGSSLDNATIENVFSCLVDAERLARDTSEFWYDRHRDGRKRLDHAAQYLWGSTPPMNIKVDDVWHYTVLKV